MCYTHGVAVEIKYEALKKTTTANIKICANKTLQKAHILTGSNTVDGGPPKWLNPLPSLLAHQ